MNLIDRTGERHQNNQGSWFTIVKCYGWRNSTIKFDNGLIKNNVDYKSILNGSVKNKLHPSVHGIGYEGMGNYCGKTHPKIYKTWFGMLERCYSNKWHKKSPSYKDCSVDTRWHNFQNFAEWFEENYTDNSELDKDLLIKRNKTYSPETCCFVPKEINNIFKGNSKRNEYPIGVSKSGSKYKAKCLIWNVETYLGSFNTIEEAFQAYKIAKEKYIKEAADYYYNLKRITEPCYQALINYKVEITD